MYINTCNILPVVFNSTLVRFIKLCPKSPISRANIGNPSPLAIALITPIENISFSNPVVKEN